MRRIVDKNSRMCSAAYNKMMEEFKNKQNSMKEKMKFIIGALTDSDKAFTLMAYNTMKQRCSMLNGVGMGDAEMKRMSLIKRLVNQGHNLQVMAVNSLREFLKSERDIEEKAREKYESQQKEKDRILKRIMDSNVRMMGTGYRQAQQWMISEQEKERILAMKQRGIMRKIVDSGTRLCGMAMNSLKAHLKDCILIDETNAGICNMRSGMMNSLCKGREGHERRQVKDALDRLTKWNKLNNMKQAICKNIVRRTLGKNDTMLSRGLNMMKENYVRRKTFIKCRQLFKTLETSDRCIDHTYRIYYKLLITHRSSNPWLKKILSSVTKSPAINPQIAFWRMRDMKTKNMKFPPNTIVKMKSMFDILKTHYTMQVARAFWKIDRCQDDNEMDSTILFEAKFAQAHIKEDFNSDMYSKNSFNKGQSRGNSMVRGMIGSRTDLSEANSTLQTPNRAYNHPKISASSPRAKYATGGGLIGLLGKK